MLNNQLEGNTGWMVHGKVLSDYLQACKEADLRTFKRDERLTKIFEHCPVRIAEEYFKLVPAEMLMKKYTNDLYGYPVITKFGTDYSPFHFSTSTMQYIGVLNNLFNYFGSLDGLRICEIGGGYGGQARTVFDVFKPACYHIIDLPEVCELQKRYEPRVEVFIEPTGQDYDLVISNYALSEIKDNKLYIDEVLKRSKHGYITCNTDFVTLPWDCFKYPDIKGERETNYILVW